MTNKPSQILVVDHDPFQIKMLSRQLADLGVSDVVGTLGGHNALALIDSDPTAIALVLCDLQMPGMDGVEFMRRLSERSFSGQVVLVSAEDERVVATAVRLGQAYKLKVLGALQKPVKIGKLRALMQMVAAQQPAAKPQSPRAARRQFTAEELSAGLDDQQLVNHYQPKVDIVTGRVVGAECLVRWQHPEHGLVFPDQFIGVAEQEGLIDDVTLAVLDNALAQTRRWKDRGQSLQVAVNLSMENLHDHHFPDLVFAALDLHGVPPTSLILEVTESRLMTDARKTMDILTRLRLRRIGLSIDDFGTGHSSLAQLNELPFDELKIDRSFVHGISRDPGIRAICKASLEMARRLHMTTVAEGVEDKADYQMLAELGATKAQGWYVAKAMAPAQFDEWHAAWNAGPRTKAA
jgi:EAL domain-containing protein (putative c-di-GMP-specific phosphodiesterase class I)/CheY-like chemotaxis protein